MKCGRSLGLERSRVKRRHVPESLCTLYELFTRPLRIFGCDDDLTTTKLLCPLSQSGRPYRVKRTGLRTGKDANLKITRTLVSNAVAVSTFASLLVSSLAAGQASRCYAQNPAQPDAPAKVAALSEPSAAPDVSPTRSTAAPDPASSADISKELAAMKARIELLEAELKSRTLSGPTLVAGPASAAGPISAAAPGAKADPVSSSTTADLAQEAHTGVTEKPKPSEPFAYADWTWLNGNARNKDAVWDSKFFTPEIRFDTHFVSSLNHPKDDTLGGSTEIFRSNEVQLEQISFGGDFHWQNVRGRVLTMGGMFAVTTPRNDGSVGRGQWDLRGAYKYFSEAWGGYHFNVNHGLNVD